MFKVLVAQLCPTLCDPMDYSPPGSSVHGILQARILEWVVYSLTLEDLSDSGIEFGSPALQANSLQSEPPGFFKHLQLTQNSARNWQDIHLCPNTLILPVTVLVGQS